MRLWKPKQDSQSRFPNKRVKTPTVLQMEAAECGAACLAMILEYHGAIIPLEKLRIICGVSRDGSKASNVLRAASTLGFKAKGYKIEPGKLLTLPLPMIIHWNFNHFVVLEGIKDDKVYLNDTATGPRVVTYEELDQAFTGVVLTFEKGPDFKPIGEKRSLIHSLKNRLAGSEKALVYVIVAGLFLIIPGIIIPMFTKIFVDNILVNKLMGWWKPLLLAMGIVILIRVILTWLQQSYLLRVESKMALVNSGKFFHHVFRLPMEFFGQRYAGDIANRVFLNDKIALLLSGQLANTALNLFTVIFYLIIMFFYSGTLTFVTIFIASLNFLILKYVSRKRVDINRRLQQEKGEFIGNAVGGIQIIETLKATGSESDFFEQWSGYQAKVVNAEQQLGFWSQLVSAAPPFLTTLANVVVLSMGGLLVIEGRLTLGGLVAFQTLMLMFLNPVNRMVGLGSILQETEADMNRLDDVMHYEQDKGFLNGRKKEVSRASFAPKLSGHLELKNVTFGYSRLEPPLIDNFNLTIKPGGRVALVGTSGSGKSTIAKLIAGLYQPWKGEILLDGKPLSSIPRDVLANSLAMVSQDIFLFEDSVRENISMWDNTIPQNHIINAAKDADIHEVIAERSGGYGSMVAEGGTNFSGGQRQRLEIATTLVNNPSILILDEATSALDAYTEKVIDDNIRQRGCTCIIVAHRLSTIRDCDEIIVLHRGKVIQRGTHEQLKDARGHYAELIEMR